MSKAMETFDKISTMHTQQAGGELTGAAIGAVGGAKLVEKAVKLINKGGKLPKALGSVAIAAGAVAGVRPGMVFGKHIGEGFDDLFNTGKYKNRGKYSKNK